MMVLNNNDNLGFSLPTGEETFRNCFPAKNAVKVQLLVRFFRLQIPPEFDK